MACWMSATEESIPVIYYVGARSVGRVKIGTTTRPRQRIKQLRAQSIDALTVLSIEHGGVEQEQIRHELFTHLRRHGEWFEWTEEIDLWLEMLRQHMPHAVVEHESRPGVSSEVAWQIAFVDTLGHYSRKCSFALPLYAKLCALHPYAHRPPFDADDIAYADACRVFAEALLETSYESEDLVTLVDRVVISGALRRVVEGSDG